MSVRVWWEVPPQHRATPDMLDAFDFYATYGYGTRYSRYSIQRYVEGLPEGDPGQCAAAMCALQAHWASKWVPPDPDPRFTTREYVKKYVRCPFPPKDPAASPFCPLHGGPKHHPSRARALRDATR